MLNNRYLKYVVIVFSIILLAVFFYITIDYYRLRKNPDLMYQRELQRMQARISKVLVLPENEIPTLATIDDVAKLEKNPFLKQAKNGYKLLIYQQAKKAILYDPEIRKVVDVAPITVDEK